MTEGRRNLLKGLLFVSPWLVGFLALTLIPLSLAVYYSLTDFGLPQQPLWIGLGNYQELWSDAKFWQALRNTALYALVALPLGLIIALGLAVLLNVEIRGQAIYRTIIFLPSLVPVVASAMLWLWLYNPDLGLINYVLRGIGVSNPPAWLGSPLWAMPALILMSFWGVGNTVVIFLAGLQDVPKDLYEAAELDGAGPVRQFVSVTLPMLSPVIFFNLVMAIIGSLQIYAGPAIMVPGGGPDRVANFYTMYLYDNAFNFARMGYASAMACVQLAIILVLTGVAFWTSRHWVHYQGK